MTGSNEGIKLTTPIIDNILKRKEEATSEAIFRFRAQEKTIRELKRKQKGRCALCGIILGDKLNVDHDHITGKVRGLLCRDCNIALGFYETRLKAISINRIEDYLHGRITECFDAPRGFQVLVSLGAAEDLINQGYGFVAMVGKDKAVLWKPEATNKEDD